MECSQLLAEDKMVGQKVSFKSSSRHEISKSNVARECRRVSQVIRLARRATAPWTKCAMRTRSNKRAFSKIQPNVDVRDPVAEDLISKILVCIAQQLALRCRMWTSPWSHTF